MGNCIAGKDGGKMTDHNTVRLIILGISGCGKTTFTKQMKILNMEGFQDFEIDNYRKIIMRNVSSGLHELILLLVDNENNVSDKNLEAVNYIKQNPSFQLSHDNIEMVKNLWKDKVVSKVWEKHKISMHNAHLDYYLSNIDRITSEGYIPSNEDIARCRQYTIGASITTFNSQKLWWKLIDVGGQVPERLKWKAIVNENDISGLIYFVAIDEFDVESEEKGKTKLDLSLKIWGDDVCGSGDFGNGKCNLLFFNKMDVFEEAIIDKKKFKAFKKWHPDYEGNKDVEEVQKYIKDKFVDVAKTHDIVEGQSLYVNFTCAIDTNKMEFAWKSIKDWVLEKRIKKGGMFEM